MRSPPRQRMHRLTSAPRLRGVALQPQPPDRTRTRHSWWRERRPRGESELRSTHCTRCRLQPSSARWPPHPTGGPGRSRDHPSRMCQRACLSPTRCGKTDRLCRPRQGTWPRSSGRPRPPRQRPRQGVLHDVLGVGGAAGQGVGEAEQCGSTCGDPLVEVRHAHALLRPLGATVHHCLHASSTLGGGFVLRPRRSRSHQPQE